MKINIINRAYKNIIISEDCGYEYNILSENSILLNYQYILKSHFPKYLLYKIGNFGTLCYFTYPLSHQNSGKSIKLSTWNSHYHPRRTSKTYMPRITTCAWNPTMFPEWSMDDDQNPSKEKKHQFWTKFLTYYTIHQNAQYNT